VVREGEEAHGPPFVIVFGAAAAVIMTAFNPLLPDGVNGFSCPPWRGMLAIKHEGHVVALKVLVLPELPEPSLGDAQGHSREQEALHMVGLEVTVGPDDLKSSEVALLKDHGQGVGSTNIAGRPASFASSTFSRWRG